MNPNQTLPRHVALIMDGNRRWARKNNLSNETGHSIGIDTLVNIAKTASDIGIEYLTFYSFSKENWNRDKDEISYLMKLMASFENLYLDKIIKKNIKIKVIGDSETLSDKHKRIIKNVEKKTEQNNGMNLIVAFNYSGRNELVRAIKKIISEVSEGNISDYEINEDIVTKYLDTRDFPDPDLIIRSGGEKRISNFLIWQSIYAEYVFIDDYWPDFNPDMLIDALKQYANR
ncbi:MAG: polyprenyl diphosphate synthase, partial [Hyphomicrobiales bacterium]